MSGYSRPLRPLLHLVTSATVVFAFVGTTAIGVASPSLTVSRKALTPSITVKPSNGLHKGQKVESLGRTFHTRQSSAFSNAPHGVKDDPAACATTHLVYVKTSSTGTLSKTSFQVITGTVGDGSCRTTKKNLTCYILCGSQA